MQRQQLIHNNAEKLSVTNKPYHVHSHSSQQMEKIEAKTVSCTRLYLFKKPKKDLHKWPWIYPILKLINKFWLQIYKRLQFNRDITKLINFLSMYGLCTEGSL